MYMCTIISCTLHLHVHHYTRHFTCAWTPFYYTITPGILHVHEHHFTKYFTCIWHHFTKYFIIMYMTPSDPAQWVLWTQKLMAPLFRTQNSRVLPLKSGVGQNIALNASPTARDFFISKSYFSGPFIFIFPQNLSRVFPVLAVADASSCVDSQKEAGHTANRHWRSMPAPTKCK